MKLLLDTHAFLWYIINDPRLLVMRATRSGTNQTRYT